MENGRRLVRGCRTPRLNPTTRLRKLVGMLRLNGVPIPEDDARRLIATLLVDRGDIAQRAANLIARGVDYQLDAVALPDPEREAILAVLEEPDGPLAELRGALFRDSLQRRRA
jgi:hypothetical protein